MNDPTWLTLSQLHLNAATVVRPLTRSPIWTDATARNGGHELVVAV